VQVFGNNVRFAVQATTSRQTYADYLENWQLCEQLGYDVAYSTDHFVSLTPEGHSVSVLESTTLLSAMASYTSTMRCGLMVAGNTFRNPGILAKTAVTLDQISNGRLELGMGSGHIQVEHEQYNIPFFTSGRRLRALGESVKLVRSLLENEFTDFDGKYYQMHGAVCDPKPIQKPLPILIGAIGEEIALRTVAESADIWNNWTTLDNDAYQHKVQVMEGYCKEFGRDPREIRRSMHVKPLVGETEAEVRERTPQQPRARTHETTEQLTESLLGFVKLGISDFVFMLDAPCDYRSLELIATKVAPTVRKEGAAILNSRG
jgi:alkanesulfonate monooxygenase SsuD/methylene tetrahydromethanopterin reductase-like flavin-dependent oxidoreductase (luciferase family)